MSFRVSIEILSCWCWQTTRKDSKEGFLISNLFHFRAWTSKYIGGGEFCSETTVSCSWCLVTMRNLCIQFAITHVPLITGGLLICTCVISYVWAVSNHHVSPFMPFISDTGTYAPESCFFGQFLNIGSFLIALTVYLRHLELRDHHTDVYVLFPRFRMLSRFSLVLGLVSALGVSLVANFQEVNQIEFHIAGAAMVFGVGAVYMWIETYISYKIHPGGESKTVCHLRLILSVIGLLGFIIMHATIAFAFHLYKPLNGRTIVNWMPVGWSLFLYPGTYCTRTIILYSLVGRWWMGISHC